MVEVEGKSLEASGKVEHTGESSFGDRGWLGILLVNILLRFYYQLFQRGNKLTDDTYSHVISPCSVTVSVHDQPRDQCMICHMISV